MSERGVFAVDRGIWDHPSLAKEPFTEREALMWMFGAAAFKPMRIRVGSVSVNLLRGQLAHSLRFMADKWDWSEPRVRRFLTRLKTDAVVTVSTDAGVTVITVCNYNKYQRVSLPDGAGTDAQIDAAATQQRRKEEDIQSIQLASDADARDPVERVLEAIGVADNPNWYGHRHRVASWLPNWDLERDILPTVKRMIANRTGPPPTTPKYFEAAIADAAASRLAPIPIGTPGKRNGTTGTVLEAADRLVERIRQFDAPAPADQRVIRIGAGANPIRAIPQG